MSPVPILYFPLRSPHPSLVTSLNLSKNLSIKPDFLLQIQLNVIYVSEEAIQYD